MDQQPLENELDKLLEELGSKEPARRKEAAKGITEQNISDQRIVDALKHMASSDPNGSARNEAKKTLTAFGITPPPLDPELARKQRDFWIGFGLWFGLNILMTLAVWGTMMALSAVYSSGNQYGTFISNAANALSLIVGFVPYVVNIGLVIYFAIKRPQIALGMLVGFGVTFAIVVCLGVIATVACFVLLSSGS